MELSSFFLPISFPLFFFFLKVQLYKYFFYHDLHMYVNSQHFKALLGLLQYYDFLA